MNVLDNLDARRDLRYALARSNYIADYTDVDAQEAYIRRTLAATEMWRIDREYEQRSQGAARH